MFRRLSISLLAVLLLLMTAPALAEGTLFSDVPSTHWAAPVVEQAVALGLMEGLGDGQFGIERTITRAEFVTVLCRMFGWTLVAPEEPSFTDVAPDRWYYTYVETAAQNGAREEGDRFRPELNITRLEMSALLVRALGYDGLAAGVAGLSSPFSDITGNGYVNIAYDIGMIRGYDDGAFRPADTARREEAAAMLIRVYERYTKKVAWVNGFFYANSFPQLDIAAEMDKVSFAWSRMMIDEDGIPYLNLTNSNNNSWYKPVDRGDEALELLDAAGVPYDLTVFAGSPTALKVCADPAERALAIERLIAACAGYAGLNIDFEGMQSGKDNFSLFMRELRAALPPEQTLSVCVPPLQYYAGGFDYRALGEVCDKVILMAHDYQWTDVPSYYVGTNRTNIVNAPAEKVYRALREITDPEVGVQDKSKIALAINFAAYGLKVDADGLLLSTTRANPYLSVLRQRLNQPDTEILWSNAHQSPYAYYNTEDGSRYIMWYEDSRSVRAKIQLARMFDIHSISFWRIGAIPSEALGNEIHYDAWEIVRAERVPSPALQGTLNDE